MTATVVLPGDLVIRTGDDFLTVREALAIPTQITSIWDLDVEFAPVPVSILFGFGWDAGIAGLGYEDVCRPAAVVGAHLAGRDPAWPTMEAHVWGLPVVDVTFQFLVTPHALPHAHPRERSLESFADQFEATAPEVATALRDMARDTSGCPGCGCGCEEAGEP